MATNTSRSQESTGTVTGPHDGRDSDGDLDHRYWRCERCGLETTDSRLREGCFRCGERTNDENSERTNDGRGERAPDRSDRDERASDDPRRVGAWADG